MYVRMCTSTFDSVFDSGNYLNKSLQVSWQGISDVVCHCVFLRVKGVWVAQGHPDQNSQSPGFYLDALTPTPNLYLTGHWRIVMKENGLIHQKKKKNWSKTTLLSIILVWIEVSIKKKSGEAWNLKVLRILLFFCKIMKCKRLASQIASSAVYSHCKWRALS